MSTNLRRRSPHSADAMSRRVSLKEFQEGLASRLKAAAAKPRPRPAWASRPAASTGLRASTPRARYCRFRRSSASADARMVSWRREYPRRPLRRFRLRRISGRPLTARGPDNRLLLIGQPFGVNCALLVSRLAGLRNVVEYAAETPSGPASAWSAAAWRDNDGRVWREMDTEQLLAQREFLEIAVH